MDSRTDIETRAATFITRRDGGEWTVADQAQLDAWLGEATLHQVTYLRLRTMWQNAARMKVFAPGIEAGSVPAPEQLKIPKWFDESPPQDDGRLSVVGHRIAVAASLLLGITSLLVWFVWPSGSSYRTQVGELTAVPMIDGSRVTLNTQSRIRVAVTQAERRVDLEEGEAFFDVAKDTTRPFVVVAGDRRVVAIGTQFSVWREGSGIRVVVTEGAVRLEKLSPQRDDVMLTAGSVVHSEEGSVAVHNKPLAEVEAALSWRSGYLTFRETPLADAIAEFNRYNQQQIVLEDPNVAAMKIDGNFRSTNAGAFLRLLEDDFAVTVERKGDRWRVRAK